MGLQSSKDIGLSSLVCNIVPDVGEYSRRKTSGIRAHSIDISITFENNSFCMQYYSDIIVVQPLDCKRWLNL